ncbi:MAG: hypothetical protein EXR58_04005 [Chloroflexi bacterium]|nr:hypothetical protein [Chloroflexota bacterium]
MGQIAESALEKLRAERNETLRLLLGLTEEECRIRWQGGNVNHELRNFASHYMDHMQHLNKILRHQNRWFTEAELLLQQAQALHGELETMVLSLSDQEMSVPGPDEGDWNALQVIEHMASNERMYRQRILENLPADRSPAPATS